MKPSLQLKIGQHLTMTPQLQQAIRLLQLSTLDLQAEIQEALDANPLLDVDENTPNEPESSSNNEQKTEQEVVDFSKSSDNSGEASNQQSEESSVELEGKDIPDDLPVDSDWDTLYDSSGPSMGSGSAGADDDFDFEGRNSAPESLYDNLMWQLNLTPMNDIDRMIAIAIVEAIDSKGYLSQSVEEIRDGVLAQQDVDKLKIDDVVGAIPVHLFAGIWGTMAVPLTNSDANFVTQAIGVGAIGAMVFSVSLVLWIIMKYTIGIRCTPEQELKGLDISEIGLEAYPEFKKGF